MTEIPEFWPRKYEADLNCCEGSLELPAGACFCFRGVPYEVEDDADGRGCCVCCLDGDCSGLCRLAVCGAEFRHDGRDVVFVRTNTGGTDTDG